MKRPAGVALLAALSMSVVRAAPEVPVEPALNEQVVMVRSHRLLPLDLETTVFRPPGEGPFPVVVINHGKAPGTNNHLQARYRPLPAVREFLKRGYAVVVPMRQGFSHSGGTVVGEGCNIAANGIAQADDVQSVVAWIEQQPWADARRMVMLGQSHGGLTTLAYARHPHPGFKLFVNFAGGLRVESRSCQWESALRSAFADYGAETRVPTLWFYGANDSYFPPAVISPAHAAYVAAGGPAEMVAYSAFEGDAHGMFVSRRGLPIWWPIVQARLAALGLPTQVIHPAFADAGRMPVPPAVAGVAVDDLARLPRLGEPGLAGYRQFLARTPPRAFAVGPDGHWAWNASADDPPRRALETCQAKAGAACRLYAVDDDVVWNAP